MTHYLQAIPLIKRSEPYSIGKDEFGVHGKTLKFPFSVWSALELKDRVIVGYDYDELKAINPKFEYWRAVFCYDLDGNVLWQVDSPYYINRETGGKVICMNGEDAINEVAFWEKENKIVVFGRMGYEVDPDTGKLGEIVYRER